MIRMHWDNGLNLSYYGNVCGCVDWPSVNWGWQTGKSRVRIWFYPQKPSPNLNIFQVLRLPSVYPPVTGSWPTFTQRTPSSSWTRFDHWQTFLAFGKNHCSASWADIELGKFLHWPSPRCTLRCLIEDTCLLLGRTTFLFDASYCTLVNHLKDWHVYYCTLDFE